MSDKELPAVIKTLKKFMKQTKTIQADLAKCSKVSEVQMSKYMNGKNKIPYKVVVSCANKMGYDVIFSVKQIH